MIWSGFGGEKQTQSYSAPRPALGVEKTKPNAGLWPKIRSSKHDNSGDDSGCLLPGVVPEIRNELKGYV